MAAILPVILCCALISLALGIVAVLGLSKKGKKPANQEEAITQQDKSSIQPRILIWPEGLMNPLQRRLFPRSLLLMMTLLLAACGSDSAASQTVTSSSSRTSPQVKASIGPVVPDFDVSTGQETWFSLSDHQGDVVILYFSFPG